VSSCSTLIVFYQFSFLALCFLLTYVSLFSGMFVDWDILTNAANFVIFLSLTMLMQFSCKKVKLNFLLLIFSVQLGVILIIDGLILKRLALLVNNLLAGVMICLIVLVNLLLNFSFQ